MFRRALRDKKGFTLIEVIVVIAIMALLVGFTVPNVDKAVEKRERRSAENDCAQVYRLAISAVSDLWTSTTMENNRPAFNETVADGAVLYDVDYTINLVKAVYNATTVMDIGLVYYDPAEAAKNAVTDPAPTTDAVAACVPDGCESQPRVKIMNGGNVKPYIVFAVQICEIDNQKVALLTVSYHNASTWCKPNEDGSINTTSAYENNDEEAIIYNFVIYNR